MKRTLFILLLTLSCAWPVLAQVKADSKSTQCTLPLDQAPELRGFRLGALQASVLSRFPGTSTGKPDQFGISQLRLTVIETTAASRGLPSRDKAVQADMVIRPGEEAGFIIDAAKFPALKGVRRIRLNFVDGRLAYVQVAYDDSITWKDIDEFVQTVALTLSLAGNWEAPAGSDAGTTKELRCESFVVAGTVGGDSTDTHIAAQLSVEDLAAAKLVTKRQNDLKDKAQREEDAKRKNFKP